MSARLGPELRHRHARIGLVHDLADGSGISQRVAVGTERVRHLAHLLRRDLRVRDVDDRRDLVLESAVSNVSGDADDLETERAGRRPSCRHRSRYAAHRVGSAEVRRGEQLAHYRDRHRALAIAFGDRPPRSSGICIVAKKSGPVCRMRVPARRLAVDRDRV